MQRNKKILDIKEKLPKGSFVIISERTGISQKTVGLFFKLKSNYRVETYKKIIKEASAIIEECNNI